MVTVEIHKNYHKQNCRDVINPSNKTTINEEKYKEGELKRWRRKMNKIILSWPKNLIVTEISQKILEEGRTKRSLCISQNQNLTSR